MSPSLGEQIYCSSRVGDTPVTFSEPRNVTSDFRNRSDHFVAWDQLPSNDHQSVSRKSSHRASGTHWELCDEFSLMYMTVGPANSCVELNPCVDNQLMEGAYRNM